MKYTDQQLLNRFASLPTFKGFGSGILEIMVRSKRDEFDVFDDKFYTFDCRAAGAPKFVMVCTGTTNAGAVGLRHFSRYNANGCAILQSDVIVYDSHVLGKHKGQYPAFIENPNNPFPYFRDSDKDQFAEEKGRIYTNNIGANMHHAGIYSTRIGGWSVACLVRNQRAQWNKWFDFVTKTAKQKKIAATVILKEF